MEAAGCNAALSGPWCKQDPETWSHFLSPFTMATWGRASQCLGARASSSFLSSKKTCWKMVRTEPLLGESSFGPLPLRQWLRQIVLGYFKTVWVPAFPLLSKHFPSNAWGTGSWVTSQVQGGESNKKPPNQTPAEHVKNLLEGLWWPAAGGRWVQSNWLFIIGSPLCPRQEWQWHAGPLAYLPNQGKEPAPHLQGSRLPNSTKLDLCRPHRAVSSPAHTGHPEGQIRGQLPAYQAPQARTRWAHFKVHKGSKCMLTQQVNLGVIYIPISTTEELS